MSSNLTNDQYHALKSVSHSTLECFRRSKRTYRAKYIDNTLVHEQTPAMQLGSLVHAMVLEPHRVDELYVVSPKCDRRTTVGKQAYAEFCESLGDREIIDAETFATAEAITKAVVDNETAESLIVLQSGSVESPMHWTCEHTQIECRSKPDYRMNKLVVDLKTCRDASPSGFAASAARFGYARQAAWYLWGCERNGLVDCRFIFIAVSTVEPYEVGIYELSERDISRARMQNRIDLEELARCERENDWQSQHEKGVVKLQLPKWAEYEDQYQLY
jgi:exodeoxyribonuclease VIII